MPWPMRFGPPPRIMILRRVGRRRPRTPPRRSSRGRGWRPRTRRRRCRRACRPGGRRAARAVRADLGLGRRRAAARAARSEKPLRLSARRRVAVERRERRRATIAAPRAPGPRSAPGTRGRCATASWTSLERQAGAERVGDVAAGGPGPACAARRAARCARRRRRAAASAIGVEAVDADLEAAQRLLQRLLEGAADGHHLADRLHLRGRARSSAPGNFSKVKRGILVTT